MGSNSHGSIRERNEYNENTNDRNGTETNATNERNDEKRVNKEKEKPWKLVIQNVVEIEGYNIFRGDKKEVVKEGTAIYLHIN